MSFSPPTLHAPAIIAVPGASPVHGPGPVQCDDSSEDDEEAGIYKVKFGADDTGNLGIKFREVSIESVKPEGMGQYRARRTLEPGFILKAINGVPADRLAYNAICELVGEYGGDIRGLTLSFHSQEKPGGRFEGFDDRPGAVEGGASSIEDQERIAELEDDIQALREELDKSRQETKTAELQRDEQETVVIDTLAPLLPRATAKHNYPANPEDFQDGDLQFEEGDTIVLLDLSDEEWGRGYVENKPEDVGDFPRSFIEITGYMNRVGSVAEAQSADSASDKKQIRKMQKMIKALQAANDAPTEGFSGGDGEAGEEVRRLQKENRQLRAQMEATEQDVDQAEARLKSAESTLASTDGGDLAATLQSTQEELRRAKKLQAKLKKRAIKDQKVIKALDGDKKFLLDRFRGVKRELQANMGDLAHMQAMVNRLQQEFAQTIPSVERMVCDRVGEELMRLETEVDDIVEGKVQIIKEDLELRLDEMTLKYQKECVERRKVFNILQEMKGNIRVFCRTRPLIPKEVAAREPIACFFDVEGEIVVDSGKGGRDGKKLFEYDQVFGPDTPQEAIFEDTKQLVQSVMDGYNVCVFAYGQTGSGKTYTMEGDLDDWRQNAGINLRALEELFRLRDEKIDEASFRIQMSMLEIYCDSVRDLLVPPSRAGASLEVKSMGDTAAYCPGLTLLPVETTQDVVDAMLTARENRATSATNMNSSSSRSHSVLTVEVIVEWRADGKKSRGKLNLIDLAGSERIAKSGATGQALKEASAINSSLTSLGSVINTLGKSKKGRKHVPYRDSKLTYLLADSLGGDAKVLMFVNCSPAESNVPETLNSLTFASRCRATELGQAAKNESR